MEAIGLDLPALTAQQKALFALALAAFVALTFAATLARRRRQSPRPNSPQSLRPRAPTPRPRRHTRGITPARRGTAPARRRPQHPAAPTARRSQNPNAPEEAPPATAVKRIVCLANSRKHGGRCVAGKALAPDGSPGEWIRPVGDREGAEVSREEREYEDGGDPKLLDIINVPVIAPTPKSCQTENWLIDARRHWRKAGAAAWDDLARMEDPPAPLWVNGISSAKGINDKVPIAEAAALTDSLRLIKVNGLRVSVSEPSNPNAAFPALRGRFRYNGVEYRLRITDPESEAAALAMDYREYQIRGARFLTVSLGEPFEGHCYKLIAAIIKPPRP